METNTDDVSSFAGDSKVVGVNEGLLIALPTPPDREPADKGPPLALSFPFLVA